eukprot:255357-Pyramimonas_sp.AAC.1
MCRTAPQAKQRAGLLPLRGLRRARRAPTTIPGGTAPMEAVPTALSGKGVNRARHRSRRGSPRARP